MKTTWIPLVVVALLSFSIPHLLADPIQLDESSLASWALVDSSRGDDHLADGSLEKPFSKIQTCADFVISSSHKRGCLLRSGVYRESVKVDGWKGERSLVFRSYPGERAVMSGSVKPTGTQWTRYKDNIFQMQLDSDFIKKYSQGFQQLFVDGVYMSEARYPNAQLGDMLDPSHWALTQTGSVYGKIVDKDLFTLGVNWTGALATLNIAHQFFTWTRYVSSYEVDQEHKTAWFTYPKDLPLITSWAYRANVTSAWTHQQFFLSGVLGALDSPGEWFFDGSQPDNWTLYLWHPKNDTPASSDVEVKVRDFCYNMTNSNNVHLEDMDFHACTFQLHNCNDSSVKDIILLYPTYNRGIPETGPVDEKEDLYRDRLFSNLGDGVVSDEEGRDAARLEYWLGIDTSQQKTARTSIRGENNAVQNISLQHSNNAGLSVDGNNNTIEEALVVSTCWLGTLTYPPISVGGGNNSVTKTTAAYFGNAGITTHGENTIVSYSHVFAGGLIGLDTAGIYTGGYTAAGTHYHHNWVHDMREKCIRGDDLSLNLTIHHNVMYNCGEPNGDVRKDGVGLIVKGIGHVIYANTMFQCLTVSRCMPACASPYKPWLCNDDRCPLLVMEQNYNTLYFNNAQLNQTGQKCGCSAEYDTTIAGGIARGIFNGTYQQMKLVDAKTFQFQPMKDSPLVDAGVSVPPYTDHHVGTSPDIGAYEFGGEIWTAGCTHCPKTIDNKF